jgi:hypothetical protein
MSRTVLDDQKPTARIEHWCSTCCRIIQPGETYRRIRLITDDGPDVYKGCAHCEAVFNEIWRTDPDVRYYEDGVDLHEYLREADCFPLLRLFEKQWRNVGSDELPLKCLPNWREPDLVAASQTAETEKP